MIFTIPDLILYPSVFNIFVLFSWSIYLGTIINTAHSHLHRDLYELIFKEVKRAKNTPNVGLEPTTPRLRVSCSTD